MTNDTEPPVLQGRKPSDDNQRLLKVFEELETKQIEFLDELAKHVIEMVSVLFGALITVFALGKDFPPPYFAEASNKYLGVGIFALYALALLCAVGCVFPRSYRRYTHNLTRLRAEFDRLAAHKLRWARLSGGLFVLGTLGLGYLLVRIILA